MIVCYLFFQQKTAYKMLISYLSSDVCTSDLRGAKVANLPVVTTSGPLVAPIVPESRVASHTEKVGVQTVTLPLVALHGVKEAGFFGRTWDSVALWVSQKIG